LALVLAACGGGSGGSGGTGPIDQAGAEEACRSDCQHDFDCGTETDTLDRDSDENRVVGCEKVQVGVLGLAPKAVMAVAGKTARVRLRWRHPQTWRKLRKVELRLARDGAPVGEVTIRPRAARIAAHGAVKLVRKETRLAREGKTVTAHLAVRLDKGLVGQTLKAEVEAIDRRGARQLERNAGTVRIAR